MENEIMKPMSVMRAEFISSLATLINSSTLPPFVIEAILKDMYSDIKIISQKQLNEDMIKYQQALNQADSTSQSTSE